MTDKEMQIVIRVILNIFFLFPYVWIIAAGYEGRSAPEWLALPILAWGFMGFRWIARNMFGGAFMQLSVGFVKFFIIYGIGMGVCAAFGFLIIPILIVAQIVQFAMLRRAA